MAAIYTPNASVEEMKTFKLSSCNPVLQFQKLRPHENKTLFGFGQNCVIQLMCGGIYAFTLLSEKLHQLIKDDPEDECVIGPAHLLRMHCFYCHILPSTYRSLGGII